MSEIKSASTCLFVGGCLDGQTLLVVGEEVHIPVVVKNDFDTGMMTYKTEPYFSVRVMLHNEKRVVKVMRINGMSDADLMAELKNWEFASDGIFRIQTCPNCRGAAVGGHVSCPTCEGAGTVRVVSKKASDE